MGYNDGDIVGENPMDFHKKEGEDVIGNVWGIKVSIRQRSPGD